MTVVLSIGGSVFSPDLDADRVADWAAVVEDLAADDVRVATVVGGGTVARNYIGAARDLGANEIALDRIGIAATRLNARLLVAGLGDGAVRAPPRDYEAAGAALDRGATVVMGGVCPAQTTDAVSAALAEYVGAERLVYATSVPGVYDADPAAESGATRFSELTASELVGLIADLEMTAGAPAPVDLLAAKVIQRAGIETIVLDGSDPVAVERAIRTDEFEGTRVVPDAGRAGE